MRRFQDFSVGVRLAMRAQYLSLSFWSLIMVIGVAAMSAQFSGRQPATVALDVGLSVIRLILPVVGVVLLQELIYREFDRRLFLSSLTYPRPRYQFLLGRLTAIFVLLIGLLASMGLALAAAVVVIGQGYDQATSVALDWRYAITLGFVAVDLFVIVALGALLAVTASTPSFVLIGTVGFMLVARSFSAIIALLQRESWLVEDAERYKFSLGLLRYLLPDLAALDVRMIALYGQMRFLPQAWVSDLGSAVAYGTAFVALALWAVCRKRFA